MVKNFTLPLKITLGNAGKKEQAFQPYKENFNVIVEPGDAIEFDAKTSGEAIYYTFQKTENLIVDISDGKVSAEAGSYNVSTGEFTSGATYSIVGETVIGTIPYVTNPGLGLQSGNVFTVKLSNKDITAKSQLPSGNIVKVTNTSVEGGYNEYTKASFEDDGSLISVINVKAGSDIEIIVKWAEDFETYRFKIEAEMESAQ